MKKILSLSAAMLLCFLAHSQEAKVTGSNAELTVIPRLDLEVNDDDYSKLAFSHGNSSLYTLFEGTIGENLSWTVANHWLSSLNDKEAEFKDYFWPYTDLGYSNTTNWIDYLKLEYTAGNWTFTLGKDCLTALGYEYEAWDWENHPVFLTTLASELSSYQWGVKAAYTTDSGNNSFSAQMVSSPFGERPFSSGLWAYSAQWRGCLGIFEPIWSISLMDYSNDRTLPFNKRVLSLLSLGNKFSFLDKFSLIIDWNAVFGEFSSSETNNARAEFSYAPSERFEFAVNAKLSTCNGFSATSVGASAHYYPLEENRDLRLHAVCAYSGDIKAFMFSVGALYNIRINCW